MMTLTTLFVVWSLVSDCECTLCLRDVECKSSFIPTSAVFENLSSLSYYDILEDRVPLGLVAEYRSLLEKCSQCFQQFSALRRGLSTDSDTELDNVSMVEGLKLYDQLETFKRKLHIIENPLLRYEMCRDPLTKCQALDAIATFFVSPSDLPEIPPSSFPHHRLSQIRAGLQR